MAANSASKMLNAGRRQASGQAHVAAVPDEPREPDAPREETPVAAELLAEATRRPVAQSYVKAGFFIRPDQRAWLNEVAARAKLDGIDGLSASDVVRLALTRLQAEVGEGLVLTDELVAQAHAEAEQFPGRKNRGLPQRRP